MANTNYLDITIADVEEFLRSVGFVWKHRYYNSRFKEFMDAEKFEDIISRYPYTTMLEVYGGKYIAHVNFFITPIQFKRYKEETNVIGSGSNIYVDRDYSQKWTDFMTERKNKEHNKTVEEDILLSK